MDVLLRMPMSAAVSMLLCLASLAGCSSTSQVEVEGTVTYGGEPVKAGSIAFIAADLKGVSGGGTILDGKYLVPAVYGPSVGTHRVEIRWAKPTGRQYKSETGAMLEITEEGLPAKYNDQSELTVEFKPGKNTVNWDLDKVLD